MHSLVMDCIYCPVCASFMKALLSTLLWCGDSLLNLKNGLPLVYNMISHLLAKDRGRASRIWWVQISEVFTKNVISNHRMENTEMCKYFPIGDNIERKTSFFLWLSQKYTEARFSINIVEQISDQTQTQIIHYLLLFMEGCYMSLGPSLISFISEIWILCTVKKFAPPFSRSNNSKVNHQNQLSPEVIHKQVFIVASI